MLSEQRAPEIERLMRIFNPFEYASNPSKTDEKLLDAIGLAASEIQGYDSKILDALASIQLLEEMKTRMQHYQESCQTFTSPRPFRQLPAELVEYILLLCEKHPISLSAYNLRYENERKIRVSTLALAHVCSQWRSIIQSNASAFVSTLNINNQGGHFPDSELPILQSAFKLFGGLFGLSVSHTTDDGPAIGVSNIDQGLIQSLAPYLFRIQRLKITGHPYLLIGQAQDTFSSLSSLELIRCRPSQNTIVDLATVAPNLQSLQISRDPSWLKVNWSKIRTLCFSKCTAPYMGQIASLCHALETLQVYSFDSEPNDSLSDSPHLEDGLGMAILYHLTTLRIKQSAGKCLELIHKYAQMPSLLRLELEDSRYYISSLDVSLATNHSIRSITFLELKFRQYPSFDHLKTIIATCNMLEVFTLRLESGPSLSSRTIDLFCYPSLPHLRHLSLYSGDPSHDDFRFESSFTSMIESRWNLEKEDRVLKSVLLYVDALHGRLARWPDSFKIDSWEMLKFMQKQGLNIHIENQSGPIRIEGESRSLR